MDRAKITLLIGVIAALLILGSGGAWFLRKATPSFPSPSSPSSAQNGPPALFRNEQGATMENVTGDHNSMKENGSVVVNAGSIKGSQFNSNAIGVDAGPAKASPEGISATNPNPALTVGPTSIINDCILEGSEFHGYSGLVDNQGRMMDTYMGGITIAPNARVGVEREAHIGFMAGCGGPYMQNVTIGTTSRMVQACAGNKVVMISAYPDIVSQDGARLMSLSALQIAEPNIIPEITLISLTKGLAALGIYRNEDAMPIILHRASDNRVFTTIRQASGTYLIRSEAVRRDHGSEVAVLCPIKGH